MAEFRSLSDLADTTQDQLLPGIINTLKKNDEWTATLIANAAVTDRPSIKFNRTASIGTASYIGCDDTITPVAISGSAVSRDLETVGRSLDVCIQSANIYSSFTDVVQSELEGALQGMSQFFAAEAITGSGSSAIYGLETEITNSFAVATSGNFDLGDLDRLYDEVLARQNLVYVAAPATVRTITAEMRTLGGFDYMTIAGTDMRVPSYLGIPIVRNQNVSSGEVHLVSMDQFKLFVGESEDMTIGGIFNMVPVGALETKLRKRWHLYTNVATALLDTQGAASLTGVA